MTQDYEWENSLNIDPSLDLSYSDIPVSLNDADVDESPATSKLKRLRSATSTSSINSALSDVRSRKRGTSAHENAANTTADGMHSLATSMTAPQETRFDQCMEILKEMESNDEITMKDLFRISRFLLPKSGKSAMDYAALFFGLPAHFRVNWLKEKNLLDTDSECHSVGES